MTERLDLNGAALLSVELGEYEVALAFYERRIRFLVKCRLRCQGQPDRSAFIEPALRTGEIEAAWKFVGKEGDYCTYAEDGFEVMFQDGSSISCERSGPFVHVIVIGGNLRGGIEYFEYPEILGLIAHQKDRER